MNPEVRQSEYTDVSTSSADSIPSIDPRLEQMESALDLDGNVDRLTPLALPPAYDANPAADQWQQVGERFSIFLADLPDRLQEFYRSYKQPITTIGLVLTAFVALKLTLAILDAVNDIPLLAPTFELIGISYAAWFVYRYLWLDTNRRELGEKFNSFKEEVLGNKKLPPV